MDKNKILINKVVNRKIIRAMIIADGSGFIDLEGDIRINLDKSEIELLTFSE